MSPSQHRHSPTPVRLPPSPPHPSGLSQCTGFEGPVSHIELGLVIYFTYGNIHVSMLFSQIIPPSHSDHFFKGFCIHLGIWTQGLSLTQSWCFHSPLPLFHPYFWTHLLEYLFHKCCRLFLLELVILYLFRCIGKFALNLVSKSLPRRGLGHSGTYR